MPLAEPGAPWGMSQGRDTRGMNQGKLPTSSSLLSVGDNHLLLPAEYKWLSKPLLSSSCAFLLPWWVSSAWDNHGIILAGRREGQGEIFLVGQ